MDNDIIKLLIPLILQAWPHVEGYIKKGGIEVGKSGAGELGKILTQKVSEKFGSLLGKLVSKRTVQDAIKQAEKKPSGDKLKLEILENALKITLTANPEILIEAKNNFEISLDSGVEITIIQSNEVSKTKTEFTSTREYVEFLNSQVSQINFPGIPDFPSGIKPTLQEIYVDQKFYISKLDRVSASHYYEMSNNSIWLKDTAGTGKSTFLKFVTSLMCKNYLNQSIEKLPIKLHAAELAGMKEAFSSELVNYVGNKYNLSHTAKSDIESHIKSGKAVLLVDAIDEIPFDSQKRLAETLTNSDFFVRHNQVILTSRPLGYLDINIYDGQIIRFTVNDAYKLISNWQKVLQNNNALTRESDELLEKFKNDFIGDVFKSGGVRTDIIETPLFLTFLIFYLSSPNTAEEANPFSILTSKTRLLSKIVEYVIPYWESQKPDGRDLITPIRNAESLRTLYFIGFITKSVPNLSTTELLWGIDQNEKILSIDKDKAREYLQLWFKSNIINLDISRVKFWHEEVKDFCAAKHLVNLFSLKIMDEADIRLRLAQPGWESVGFYFYNTFRSGVNNEIFS